MTTTANDVLMGGGGAPTAKLAEGITVSGRIVAISEPYQEREYDPNNAGGGAPKYFKSGDPIMTFNVDVDTGMRDPSIEDDDGIRRIYMDGARIKKAVRDGVRASGAPGLAVGGTLTVTCTHYDTPGDVRSGKNYSVQYAPGAAANNVLMGQQATPPPAPVQAPQPQPAYTQPVQPQPVAQPAYAPPAPQPVPAAAPVQPTPEQLAAVRQVGVDPKVAFPGYTGD